VELDNYTAFYMVHHSVSSTILLIGIDLETPRGFGVQCASCIRGMDFKESRAYVEKF
jgi:hypothetical protein